MILLTDFGSTYTKLTAVDIEKLEVKAAARAVTTVDTDVMIGLRNALDILKGQLGKNIRFREKLAASSAAGGLRMVAVGLVPELTARAAELAALKAGAKVVGVYSYKLTEDDLEGIQNLLPDIILLAGGTDGGNTEIIIHNAGMLSRLKSDVPIVMAGNCVAAKRVENILARFGKRVYVTENVLPNLKQLNVEPAREVIREVFIEKIIHAKGIDKAKEFVDGILMPTPAAVLEGAKLLADGTHEEKGIGELLVVDVGGATTDVHSVNYGIPSNPRIILKGFQEPYAKRTVEGDLGVRYNAPNLFKMLKPKELNEISPSFDIHKWVKQLSEEVGLLPDTEEKVLLDQLMAKKAVEIAVERHAGTLKTVYTPEGIQYFQKGKDLTEIKYIIGTGGVIIHSKNPREILEGSLLKGSKQGYLKPVNPQFLLDEKYILSAMGLMSIKYPLQALKIMKKYLKKI